MHISELRKKDDKALLAELERAHKEKLASKLSLKMRQSKESHVMKKNAITIAQIKMLRRERQTRSAAERPAKDHSQAKP